MAGLRHKKAANGDGRICRARKALRRKVNKDLLKRVLTTAALLPLFIFIVVCGGVFLRIAILIISVVGMNEIYSAISKDNKKIHAIGYIFAVIYTFMLEDQLPRGLYVITSLFIMTLLIYVVITYGETNITDLSATMFGFYYVTFLMSNIYLAREFTEYGKYFVWLIFICAWVSDTAAFLVGGNFGKHKIAPRLSPNKTLEGAAGGVCASCLAAFIYGYVLYRLDLVNIFPLRHFALIGVLGSLLSQAGDLAASAIKRYTGIKDFGFLLPGHGGVLDRFDSVLFTAPAVYLIMRVLFHFYSGAR